MQKIVTTATLQTCQWPVAFQPWLGNTVENPKRDFRSGFFWNLQLLLGSCMKTFCHKQSEQCESHVFIVPRKMGDAKNTMATTVNLILYHTIQPEFAERWLQPATQHKQCQCGLCPRFTRKEKGYTSNRDWNTLQREICSFRHHNATNDGRAFLLNLLSF